MSWIDLALDAFRNVRVGLEEDFFGAIRKVNADFQRRTASSLLWGARVDCIRVTNAVW